MWRKKNITKDKTDIRPKSWTGANAINIFGLLNPKKLGNFKN